MHKYRIRDYIRCKNTGVMIHPRYKRENQKEYTDGKYIEERLLNILKNTKDLSDGSDDLRAKVNSWALQYHLAPGRSNIIEALDVIKNKSILELGCGCGAITRYLGENARKIDAIEGSYDRSVIARERCRDLKNVSIYVGNINDVEFERIYDIITVIGVLEYAPIFYGNYGDARSTCIHFLKHISSALVDNGIVTIAIENKIGLKYWSGCPEDHGGGVIYSSLEGYPYENTPITFSKSELNEIMLEAGFKDVNYFYCFPDYKFASTIFTDNKVDNVKLGNWIDVPFTSNGIKRIVSFDEGLVLDTIERAGLLYELANSFLIVASKNGKLFQKPKWIVKKYSFRRRKDFRCVTTLDIDEDLIVRKQRINDKSKNEICSKNNVAVRHIVSEQKYVYGDSMYLWLKKIGKRKNAIELISNELIKYKNILERDLTINEKEFNGWSSYSDRVPYDRIIRNCIKLNDEYIFIDDEWRVNTHYDYILFHCVTQDVMSSIGREILDRKTAEAICYEMMKVLIDNYSIREHEKNRRILEDINEIVIGNICYYDNCSIDESKSMFGRSIEEVVRYIYRNLPINIKLKISNMFMKYKNYETMKL